MVYVVTSHGVDHQPDPLHHQDLRLTLRGFLLQMEPSSWYTWDRFWRWGGGGLENALSLGDARTSLHAIQEPKGYQGSSFPAFTDSPGGSDNLLKLLKSQFACL